MERRKGSLTLEDILSIVLALRTQQLANVFNFLVMFVVGHDHGMNPQWTCDAITRVSRGLFYYYLALVSHAEIEWNKRTTNGSGSSSAACDVALRGRSSFPSGITR